MREIDAPLPASLTGELTIRLIDLDRAPGEDFRNTVLINELRIDSGAAFADKRQIDWLGAASATHYDILRGDLAMLRVYGGIGEASCDRDDLAATTYVDADMPGPGTGFTT